MIPAKPLVLFSTFVLGSCVPLSPPPPPPSITIYNSIDSRLDKEIRVVCKSGGTYALPPLPELGGLAEGDDQGVVDRLNEHIGLLRSELTTLAAHGGCGK